MEFAVWDCQTSLLYCLPLGKILPYWQSLPEAFLFFQVELFQLSHPFCMTDAPIFSWSLMNSVCLSCANKAKIRPAGYSTADVTSSLLHGEEGSLLSILLATLVLMKPRVLLAFLLQGHIAVSCSAWYFDFPHLIPAHSNFIPSKSHIPASTSCMFYFHVEVIRIILFFHAQLFSCQDGLRLGEVSPRSPFSPGLSTMGFSQGDPGGKMIFIWSPAFCLVSSIQDLELHHLVVTATRLTLTFPPLTSSSLLVNLGSSRSSSFVDSWIFRKGDWLALVYCHSFL